MIRNLLVLPSGEEIFSGQVGENALKSVKLTQCVNNQEDLEPGAVCAAMLEATLITQGEIPLSAGDEVALYSVSDDLERTLAGIFVAEKPVWQSAHTYKLTAYDRICRLDKDLSLWVSELTGWPYALGDFATMVCEECGLTLKESQILNRDYPVEAFSAAGITGRQLMQWIGQIAGRFCRATADGEVEFAWYRESGKTIAAEEKHEVIGQSTKVVLEDMEDGAILQTVSEIKPRLTGVKNITLRQKGKNILDIHTADIFHSNPTSTRRYKMTFTDRGFRVETIAPIFMREQSLWGFCLGTAKELAGKTLTFSADYSTALTGAVAVPCFGFYGMQYEPFAGDREYIEGGYGGYVFIDPSMKKLKTSSTEGVRSISYTVNGDENTYIAVLMNLCAPGKNTAVGDWAQWDNIQVEIGDTATSYVPGQERVFTQAFPQTVYGGSFDWNSGTLLVTHERIDSYAGEAVPDGWISNTGELSEGARVVYALAEPYSIQLTPQPIAMLSGRNTITVDKGTIAFSVAQDYYFQNSLSYEDYAVAKVEKVQIRLTDTDVGAVYPDTAAPCNTYILAGNYLLTNTDASRLETVAQELYLHLKDIAYTPCKVDVPAGVAVGAGDIVTITDKNGRSVTAYVMNHTRSGQRKVLECTGNPWRDNSAAANRQDYKALSGKVMELRTDIEGLRATHREAQGSFAQIAMTVEGIATEVLRQQTAEENLTQQLTTISQTADQVAIAVRNLQDNGVCKVQTQMGYTFDDAGLRISRDHAEMSNLLDNTGMYVARGADLVLQANNEGVRAMNITVENYLTIGSHARFEDYNNGTDSKRTACFWLGG